MQEYGVGGGKADLQKVLEACTKELQKLPEYNNDIRFLRIWIQYVSAYAGARRAHWAGLGVGVANAGDGRAHRKLS
jgi:hypothetical protein